MKYLLVVLSVSVALCHSDRAFAQDRPAAAGLSVTVSGAKSAPIALASAAEAMAAKTEAEAASGTALQVTPPYRERPTAKSTTWEALKGGLIGGAIGGLISAGLNYYVLPLPHTAADNAIGHGMSGFFCGLASGFIGVMLYARQQPSENTGR